MTEQSATAASATAAAPALSTPTVFLHIGTMKTGTSFLQAVLRRNAELLASHGVLYPLADSGWGLQVRATREILGILGRPTFGAWAAMLDQIRAWPGRAALVSMEFFSLASAQRAQQVVAALAPSEVVVIVTARDLVRVLPSAWQSMVKNGRVWPYREFVRSAAGSGDVLPDAHRRFWRHHDIVTIARNWITAVGGDNVHLVTVPRPGAPPAELWRRFATVIGVDPEPYDVSQNRNSNFSLSYSDTELMRQVNLALGSELSKTAYKKWANRYFANRVLRVGASEKTAHDRPALEPEAYDWAVERSAQMVAALDELGVHVAGDLGDLVPSRALRPQGSAPSAPATTYPGAAAHVISALLCRIAAVDPQLLASTGADLQDPDDAADADEADEADEAGDELLGDLPDEAPGGPAGLARQDQLPSARPGGAAP